MTPEDAQALRMLAGASFGPNASLTLPSGETLTADEAQAFSAAYARPQRVRHDNDGTSADREWFLRHCRPARPSDYAAWLRGWMGQRGAVTHEYNYPMPDSFVVVTSSGAVLPSLYGSESLAVIVPAGITLSAPATFHRACGHSTVYRMDEFEILGDWVPTYPDVLAWLSPAA